MKKIGIVLMAIGIIIAMIPIGGKLYINWQRQALIKGMEYSDTPIYSEGYDPAEEYEGLDNVFSQEIPTTGEEETVDPVKGNTAELSYSETSQENTNDTDDAQSESLSNEQVPSKKKEGVPQVLLGRIIIKKIKVDVAVVEGVKNENLRIGVGHIPGTAGIGEAGNCVLAGHRSYTFGKYFNRLNEVELGDEIVITGRNGTYNYTVFKKFIVEPSDLSVLENSEEGERLLTLITCEPIYVASHRLIIQAKTEVNEEEDNRKNKKTIDNTVE